MSITAPWLRLASDFADSPMFDTIDNPGPLLAWVGLLCEAKERGRGGRFTLRRATFCRRYRVSPEDLDLCLRVSSGALRVNGDVCEFVNWRRYQDGNVRSAQASGGQWHDLHDSEQSRESMPTHHPSPTTHHTSQSQGNTARTRAKPRSEQQPDGVWGSKAIKLDTNARTWTGITEADLETWMSAFPAVDINVGLSQALSWCLANPARGRKSNYEKFLHGWFSRAQDAGGNRGTGSVRVDDAAAKRAAILDEIKRRDAAKAGGEW